MAQSLHMVLGRNNNIVPEGLWGYTVERDNLTAGSSPSGHEAFTQPVPEELTICLHPVYSDPIGHKTTHYNKFKTYKKVKLQCTIGRQQKKNQDHYQSSRTIQEVGTWYVC